MPCCTAVKLRLREEQVLALKQRAEKEGISLHAMVLKAIDDYLALPARPSVVRKTAREQAAGWREPGERLG
ncbi:CopG family transcriptional regulator [Streptomyces sp. SID5475]|nr:CopG family transcriptional regulator [Streptomyces sp. SID5475]